MKALLRLVLFYSIAMLHRYFHELKDLKDYKLWLGAFVVCLIFEFYDVVVAKELRG